MVFRVAVLASGSGTTFEAIAKAFSGHAHIRPVVVVTNNPSAGVIQRAKNFGVRAVVVRKAKGMSDEAHDQLVMNALREEEPHLVVLAGYMRVLGKKFVQAFSGRLINTHPALLPRHGGPGMYGDKVHEAALKSGDAWSGASVHYVDEGVDTGQVIKQVAVPLLRRDSVETLRRRVQKEEKKLLVRVIRDLARKHSRRR